MGYHLHGHRVKQKAGANNRASLRKSLAPALKALALVDIHDVFGLTIPAIGHDPEGHGVGVDFHYPLVFATMRTFEISAFHYQHSTMHFLRFQCFLAPFPKVNILLKAEN